MKKLAIILLVLFLIPFALADDTYNQKSVGDTMEDGEWTLTIVNIYSTSVAISAYGIVDPLTTKSFTLGTERTIYGLKLNITNIFYSEVQAERRVSFSSEIIWRHECDEASDCEDANNCTIEQCIVGINKRTCNFINISSCINGDHCCPDSCTRYSDSDCQQYPCDESEDCNDRNVHTNDTCNEDEGKCVFTPITWCYGGDDYCPDNCTYTEKMVDNRDSDCSKTSLCIANIECNDNDPKTIDLCFADPNTDPKVCKYETNTSYFVPDPDEPEVKQEYVIHEPCARLAERINEEDNFIYCSLDGWVNQRSDGAGCKANFECKSNNCESFICTEQEFIKEMNEDEKVSRRNIALVTVLLIGIAFYFLVITRFLSSKPKHNNL